MGPGMADETRASTTRWTDFLGWGPGGRPDDDDPAETYHEASKNLPSVQPVTSPVATALDTDSQAQATITRSVKRHPALPVVALPAPRYPDAAFEKVVRERRSRRRFGSDPIGLQDFSTLLHATYGVTQGGDDADGTARGSSRADATPEMRSVPSGGALYPLEVYPAVRAVDGLAPGLYHYDPSRHLLEVVDERDVTEDLERVMIPLPGAPDLAATCAATLFVVGVFWRTRFKYGLRGYRWTLIEAGHVGQSCLLAAEALGIDAVPYGGFWDRQVDDLLGLDGVNESVVYSLVTGQPAPE